MPVRTKGVGTVTAGLSTFSRKGGFGRANRHAQPSVTLGAFQRRVGEEPLFLSEWGRPLTENGIALLFGRLRKRAGITRTGVNPSLLRDSFAVRYLQAGGDLHVLRELLGHEESVRVKRSLRIRE